MSQKHSFHSNTFSQFKRQSSTKKLASHRVKTTGKTRPCPSNPSLYSPHQMSQYIISKKSPDYTQILQSHRPQSIQKKVNQKKIDLQPFLKSFGQNGDVRKEITELKHQNDELKSEIEKLKVTLNSINLNQEKRKPSLNNENFNTLQNPSTNLKGDRQLKCEIKKVIRLKNKRTLSEPISYQILQKLQQKLVIEKEEENKNNTNIDSFAYADTVQEKYSNTQAPLSENVEFDCLNQINDSEIALRDKNQQNDSFKNFDSPIEKSPEQNPRTSLTFGVKGLQYLPKQPNVIEEISSIQSVEQNHFEETDSKDVGQKQISSFFSNSFSNGDQSIKDDIKQFADFKMNVHYDTQQPTQSQEWKYNSNFNWISSEISSIQQLINDASNPKGKENFNQNVNYQKIIDLTQQLKTEIEKNFQQQQLPQELNQFLDSLKNCIQQHQETPQQKNNVFEMTNKPPFPKTKSSQRYLNQYSAGQENILIDSKFKLLDSEVTSPQNQNLNHPLPQQPTQGSRQGGISQPKPNFSQKQRLDKPKSTTNLFLITNQIAETNQAFNSSLSKKRNSMIIHPEKSSYIEPKKLQAMLFNYLHDKGKQSKVLTQKKENCQVKANRDSNEGLKYQQQQNRKLNDRFIESNSSLGIRSSVVKGEKIQFNNVKSAQIMKKYWKEYFKNQVK